MKKIVFLFILLVIEFHSFSQDSMQSMVNKGGFTIYPINQQFGFRNSPTKKIGFEVKLKSDLYIVSSSFVSTITLNARMFKRKVISKKAYTYFGGGVLYKGFLSDPLVGIEMPFGAEVFPFNEFNRFSFIGELSPYITYGVGDASIQISAFATLGVGFYLKNK